MRTEQMANRIKNQNFFQRNLFPRMFGWFLIRLVDREFECSTLEDVYMSGCGYYIGMFRQGKRSERQ